MNSEDILGFQLIEDKFENHLKSIDELINFDNIILDYCINHLNELNQKLKEWPFNITNPTYLAENALKAIGNVRQNESLRINYESIFNSCLVLQVSYFTIIIDEIFKVSLSWIKKKFVNNLDQKIPKNEINFQNMHSIIKSYKNHIGINIKKDELINAIILAILSRHAIIHSNSIADHKFINNINSIVPRAIKQQIGFNDKIQYTSSELGLIKISMQQFISQLCNNIRELYNI